MKYPHPLDEVQAWQMNWQDPEWNDDSTREWTHEPPFDGKMLAHLMGCKSCRDYYDDMVAEDEWTEKELARGKLAFCPETMECYECGWQYVDTYGEYSVSRDPMTHAPFIERKVVDLGPILEPRRDPTQSYRLECDHLAF